MGKEIIIKDVMHIWESMEWEKLKPSSKVDIALILFGIKPAARLSMSNNISINTNVLNIFFYTLSLNDTLYISTKDNCKEIHSTDFSTYEHTAKLGNLLGYPACCSKYIEKKGESNIDAVEENFLKKINKNDSLISTAFYYEGFSLISHVPCKPSCSASLNSAKSFIKKILDIHQSPYSCPSFNNWVEELIKRIGVPCYDSSF